MPAVKLTFPPDWQAEPGRTREGKDKQMRPTLANENVKDGTMHQTLAHINTQKYPQILIVDGAIPVHNLEITL